MGKKDKKKGGGMEKTLAKTEKNLAKKMKRQSRVKCGAGELEQMVQRLTEEAAERREISETVCTSPSPRAALTMCVHPEREELLFFGGELYDGKQTSIYGDLLLYRVKQDEWRLLQLPAAPPPRSGHAAVCVPRGGGQMWVFGGEYSSPDGQQFYHYRDLWCLHINQRRWERIKAVGGPSARSGHRMVYSNGLLLLFGGFHDSGQGCPVYMNDVHAFCLDQRAWLTLDISGQPPTPRSAVLMLTVSEARVLVYGGYSRQRLITDGKRSDHATTHTDMFHLVVSTSDDDRGRCCCSLRWELVKQSGQRPPPRGGVTGCCIPAGGQQQRRVLVFGGVSDQQSEDTLQGTFYNDMFWLEPERGHWRLAPLCGPRQSRPRRRRRKPADGSEEAAEMVMDRLAESLSVEGGDECPPVCQPSARSQACMVSRGARVYLFGGHVERGTAELTLADFYSLDTSKMDEWKTLVAQPAEMVWQGSDDEDESMDDDDDDDEEGEDDDDTDDSMDDE